MPSMTRFLAVATLSLALLPSAATAQRMHDGERAFRMTQRGEIRPLREIEGRIVPRMQGAGADYLGPELDVGSGTYRLKFMRSGSVIWVDVDARTGAIVGRSGR